MPVSTTRRAVEAPAKRSPTSCAAVSPTFANTRWVMTSFPFTTAFNSSRPSVAPRSNATLLVPTWPKKHRSGLRVQDFATVRRPSGACSIMASSNPARFPSLSTTSGPSSVAITSRRCQTSASSSASAPPSSPSQFRLQNARKSRAASTSSPTSRMTSAAAARACRRHSTAFTACGPSFPAVKTHRYVCAIFIIARAFGFWMSPWALRISPCMHEWQRYRLPSSA